MHNCYMYRFRKEAITKTSREGARSSILVIKSNNF